MRNRPDITAPRLELARPALTLPEPGALDGLDAAALVAIAERAAALHAGALARLALRTTAPASPPPADEHLTAEQVAQLLNAEPAWVYRHAGQLGAVKLDGILRFPRRRLEAYLARQARLGDA
jgi:hypothetical protein